MSQAEEKSLSEYFSSSEYIDSMKDIHRAEVDTQLEEARLRSESEIRLKKDIIERMTAAQVDVANRAIANWEKVELAKLKNQSANPATPHPTHLTQTSQSTQTTQSSQSSSSTSAGRPAQPTQPSNPPTQPTNPPTRPTTSTAPTTPPQQEGIDGIDGKLTEQEIDSLFDDFK